MGDDRSSAYWETDARGDYAVLRASALGAACEASLVRSLVGQPAEPWPTTFLTKFAEGVEAEPVLLRILHERYGWKMLERDKLSYFGQVGDDGQVETELTVGRHRVRCHPDGVVMCVDEIAATVGGHGVPEWVHVGQLAVVECKALSASMFDKWRTDPWGTVAAYRWQAAVEMLTTDLPMVYVVGRKDADGRLDEDSVKIKYVTEPPVNRVEIAKKVMRIVGAAQKHEAGGPMLDCVDGGQYPCGYYRMTDAACNRDNRDKGGTVETDERVAQLARLVWSHDQVVKRETERRDNYKAELLELVDRSCEAGDYEIVYRAGGVGAVSWKGAALELAEELGMDEQARAEWEDRHIGADRKASVTVRKKETDEAE